MSESFAHQLRLDQIRDGDRADLTASDSERLTIAGDLGLKALGQLDAHAVLERKGDIVRVTGRMLASLTQACVVTGDPVTAHVDEPFDLLFTPAAPGVAGDSEIELGPEDCDTIFHDGATIDLGRAILDTLALSVDPYPRSAGADAALKDAGIMTEEQAGPFAALAALRKGRESAD